MRIKEKKNVKKGLGKVFDKSEIPVSSLAFSPPPSFLCSPLLISPLISLPRPMVLPSVSWIMRWAICLSLGTRPRKASRCGSISLPASARERCIMCATAPVAQNGEKGDEEGKKERRRRRRKIQIWKWSLGLQTDRKFCLTDDGCSGRGGGCCN